MNARIGRPQKGSGKGEDSIFVATHLSGLKVRSIVAFKSPPVPVRKDPALRGSAKKGTNAWNLFLSEKMDEVALSHPGLKKPDLLKIVAQMWKEQKVAADMSGLHGSPDGSNKQSVGSSLSDDGDSDIDEMENGQSSDDDDAPMADAKDSPVWARRGHL